MSGRGSTVGVDGIVVAAGVSHNGCQAVSVAGTGWWGGAA